MNVRLRLVIVPLVLIGQMAWSFCACADALVLKSGGELRGELQLQPKPSGRNAAATPDQLTIRTIAGAIVTVARDAVDEVVRRRPLLEEYETLRCAAADTVDAQWELAEWCRGKSLSNERATHLRRVVELDPQHVAAHRGLGHIRHEGRWTTTEAMMTARGYVKHKGRFVLPQELELIEAEERETEAEKAWFKRIRMWANWLDSERPERQSESLSELRALRDGEAVLALHKTFKDSPNEQKRLLYVEILTRIPADKALNPLVQQSLRDDSTQVRDAAVRGVRQHDVAAALPMYLRALKNELNVIVNRAGNALGQLGDDTVVPLLIEALVTRHQYKVMVPDQSIGVNTDGSMAGGGVPIPPNIALMLAAGQLPQGIRVENVAPPRMKQITVQQDEQNPAVLAALNLLTGEDFGFDEPVWRSWYNARVSGAVKSKKKTKSSY